jgi:hypothetical protein
MEFVEVEKMVGCLVISLAERKEICLVERLVEMLEIWSTDWWVESRDVMD